MLPERIAWTNIKNLDERWCLMFDEFRMEMKSGRPPSDRFLAYSANHGAYDLGNLSMRVSNWKNASCLTNLIIRDSRIT